MRFGSAYSCQGTEPKIASAARIAGIHSLSYVERLPEDSTKRGNLSWSEIFIATVSAFCLFIFGVGLYAMGVDTGIRRMKDLGHITLPNSNSVSDYEVFLARLPGEKNVDLKAAKLFLRQQPPSVPLGPESVKHLQTLMEEALRTRYYSILATMTFGILAAIGIAYLSFFAT